MKVSSGAGDVALVDGVQRVRAGDVDVDAAAWFRWCR